MPGCLCLLLGLGLSTSGQFVELDKSMSRGQIGFSHSTYETFNEKYDETGLLGRITLLKTGQSKLMTGLTLDVEHHPESTHYNETYLTSIPSLDYMVEPSISKDIKFLLGAEFGKGFHTLKGDLVKRKNGFEAKYNFTVGLFFKIK